jgi:hypothetical protein
MFPEPGHEWQPVTDGFEYFSLDGGLTWHQRQPEIPHCDTSMSILTVGNVSYGYVQGEYIHQSADNLQSWQIINHLTEYDADVRQDYYYFRDVSSNHFLRAEPGPHDMVYDADSGNVIFAMGWDGVLVLTPEGDWLWVEVGELYYLDSLKQLDKVPDLLRLELQLCIGLILLVIVTANVYMRRQKATMRLYLLLAWIIWMLMALNARSDIGLYYILGFFGIILWALPLGYMAISDFLEHFPRKLLHIISVSIITVAMYLFPLILWSQGHIPVYATARGLSFFLIACALVWGYGYLKEILPVQPLAMMTKVHPA